MPLEKSAAVRRAKTKHGRRAMQDRDAKLVENPKKLLILRGHATSIAGTTLLKDLHILKKPLTQKMNRKNDVLPFDAGGETHLENLARLNDTSLFALANHTKKRPDNIILGRMFDFRILDMIEFGIQNYMPMATFSSQPSSAVGSTPCLLFNGDDYNASETTQHLKSVLFEVFRGPCDVSMVNLAGVDRALVFTLKSPRVGPMSVTVRHYSMVLKKIPNSRLPRVELVPIGPSFDLVLRRTQFAPEFMRKEAMRVARDPRVDGKRKNISKNELGDTLGRVHVGSQDLSGLVLARMKGLGKKRAYGIDGALAGVSEEDSGDDENVDIDRDEDEAGTDEDSGHQSLGAIDGAMTSGDSIDAAESGRPHKRVRIGKATVLSAET